MNRDSRKLLGAIIIVAAILIILNRLNIFTFHLLFDGWWTLLLIIPALLSMRKQGATVGNGLVLLLGVYFFLEENGWNLAGLLMPAILIIIGIGLLIKK